MVPDLRCCGIIERHEICWSWCPVRHSERVPHELVFGIVCWALQHDRVLHEVLLNRGHEPLLEAPIGLLLVRVQEDTDKLTTPSQLRVPW